MRRLVLVPALLLVASAALAQPEIAPPLRAERVAEGIHVLFGRGGNIGVCLGPDGTFLVDDQFAPATPEILAKVRE